MSLHRNVFIMMIAGKIMLQMRQNQSMGLTLEQIAAAMGLSLDDLNVL